jgi:hypothetical protein
MVYNAIYFDGNTSISYAKRFSVTSIIRDREYDITQGSDKSQLLYFTANPNSESEMVTVNLHNSVNVRKKIFDFDFGELAIKDRGVKGNIVSKHRVRKVAQKEVGESTLGGRDIWLDENIGRLNVDKQGRYLGSLSTFNLPIFSSNHISRPPKVDSPTSFCATFRTRCLDTIFPFTPLSFIASSPKSKSNIFLRTFTELCRLTVTISDSLFGFAVKYNNCDL